MDDVDLLDRRIERFEAPSGNVSDCANRLRELGLRVCSFENLGAREREPLVLQVTTLRGLLDAIVARNPGYRWEAPSAGLINLFPRESVLDSPVPDLAVSGKGAWRVLDEDLHVSAFGISLFQEFGDPDGPPVSVRLEDADLRNALNAIVAAVGSMVWHIAGQPGEYHLSFSTVYSTR